MAFISTDVVWILFSVMCILASPRQCEMVAFRSQYIHCSLGAISAPLRQIKAITRNVTLWILHASRLKDSFPHGSLLFGDEQQSLPFRVW